MACHACNSLCLLTYVTFLITGQLSRMGPAAAGNRLAPVALTDRLEQSNSCRHRDIQAIDRAEHRDRDEPVATLAHQSPQTGALGSEHQGGRERQVHLVI